MEEHFDFWIEIDQIKMKWTGCYSDMLTSVEGLRIAFAHQPCLVMWQTLTYKHPSFLRYEPWLTQMNKHVKDEVYTEYGKSLRIRNIDAFIHNHGAEAWASCLTKTQMN